MKNSILTIVAFLMVLHTFSQTSKLFKNDKIQFEIPINWIEFKLEGQEVVIKEPATENYLTVLTTYSVEIDTNNLSLSNYSKGYEQRLKNNFIVCDIENKKKFKFNGNEALDYKWFIMMKIEDKMTYIVVLSKLIKIDNKIYNISVTTTEEKNNELHSEYIKKFFDSISIFSKK